MSYRITVHGTWGHGSMPRRRTTRSCAPPTVIARLAVPGPPRLTPVMARFFDALAAELPPETAALVRDDRRSGRRPERSGDRQRCAIRRYGRAARALLRDTIAPNVVHAGVKYNVIPGVARIEIDCRVLPGTDPRR